MKMRLNRLLNQGLGGGTRETRVVEVADDEPAPEGAVGVVTDDTPLSDWAPIDPASATAQATAKEEPECRRIF